MYARVSSHLIHFTRRTSACRIKFKSGIKFDMTEERFLIWIKIDKKKFFWNIWWRCIGNPTFAAFLNLNSTRLYSTVARPMKPSRPSTTSSSITTQIRSWVNWNCLGSRLQNLIRFISRLFLDRTSNSAHEKSDVRIWPILYSHMFGYLEPKLLGRLQKLVFS
jgi:hypothetical protein